MSALFGCNDSFDTNALVQSAESTSTFKSRDATRPAEAPLVQISELYPEFAGYYCDRGDLAVGVVAPSNSDVALAVLELVEKTGVSRLCRRREFPDQIPRVVAVEHANSLRELRGWRDILTDNLLFATDNLPFATNDSSDTASVGIDYQRNKVVLGVRHGHTQNTAVAASTLQVPMGAYEIVEEGETSLTVGYACPSSPYDGYGLQHCFRPVPGGVQMGAADTGSANGYGDGTLTLGVTKNGIPGWVTCSHCVPAIAQQQADWVFQPNPYVTPGQTSPIYNHIGTEVDDPPTWACGQASLCRYSDSARVLQVGGPIQQGQIAQTWAWNGWGSSNATCCGYEYDQDPNTNCSACVVNTSHPRFYVSGYVTPVQGMEVEKVGRSTGWTTGTIGATCNDEPDGLGHIYVCNGRSTNPLWYGDSGSPLFHWSFLYGSDVVEMVGIVWAMKDNWLVWSSWENVQMDLGVMDFRYHSTFMDWASAPNVRARSGDFNGDGRSDIALFGGSGWYTIPVAFSQPNGSFSVTNYPVSSFPAWASDPSVHLVIGKVNNDAYDDIIATGYGTWTTIPVAFSNGDGTFNVTNVANATLPGLASQVGVKALAGDVNSDGKADLILVGGAGWTGIWSGLSTGSGSFSSSFGTVSDAQFPGWANAAGVKAISGDLDIDGDADIALTGGAGWYTVPVAFRLPNGTWSISNQAVNWFAGWSQSSTVRFLRGDVNLDQKADLLLTGGFGWSTIPLATSNGNGTFNVTNPSVPDFPAWASASGAQAVGGDFNGDGRTDVALVGGNGWITIPIALANGSGGFTVSNKVCP